MSNNDALMAVEAYEKWWATKPAENIAAPRSCAATCQDKTMAIWLSAWESAKQALAPQQH